MKRLRLVFLLGLLLLVGLLLAQSEVGSTAVAQTPAAPYKVIAAPGVLDAAQSGITLWHDYGSFALYRIQPEAWRALPAAVQAQTSRSVQMDHLLFDAYPFDTQRDTLQLPPELAATELSGSALHLIQFVGPIKDEWLRTLQTAGVEPIHYIANNGYLVWTGENGRRQLAVLEAQGDFVQYSAPYHPTFKLGASLRERHAANALTGIVPVVIQMLNHEGKAATADFVDKLLVERASEWEPVLAYQNIYGTLRLSDLIQLAQRPDVVWIGERFPRQLLDEVQGQILAANFDGSQAGPDTPGYLDWLNSYGVSTDPADYPVVDITDDGIGDGTVNSGDPTLHELGQDGNSTRLAYVANCTGASDGGGPDGHGHINVSIAGGYDLRAGFPYEDDDGYQRGLGINPYGRFAGTRIFTSVWDISACGGTDTGLIKSIQDNGADISSNSWGCGDCAGSYDDSSQAFDVGVRDADLTESGNQEMVFIFAAGNSGPGAGTVGTPGNGKNMITVGASENDRPTWTDGCNVGPSGADNAMDVIGFSSRGPSPGDRVKPELIAPGTHIQGTASTHPSYNGSGVCDPFQPGGQTVFAASSGTSHSTPAVAGVASLYYHWLESSYNMIDPSNALLKAYLIAHPTYLTGVDANDTLPSNDQGYGMPDMARGLDDTPRYLVDQSHIFDDSGATWTFDGAVAAPGEPVYIVLAYTDQAGAIGTSPQVNDLNLEVTVNGMTYLGNQFNGQWSVTGGTADANNNYEAVFLPAGTTGALNITITAFNIAGDGIPNSGDGTDQDFALVCYNCAQNPDFTLRVTPRLQSICTPNDALYDITVGQILSYSDSVTLSSAGQPAGTTVHFQTNPVTPPGTSQLTLTGSDGATAGHYEIAVLGVAPTSTHTNTVGLDLFTAIPTAPTPTAPANGATNQDVPLTLAWTAVAQGETYAVQIATDSAFNNVVEAAAGLTGASYTAGNLQTNTVYYWRVGAENSCGTGGYSATYQFATTPAPGDCMLGTVPNVVLSEGFETGAAGWSHGGTGDTWTLSSSRVHSGVYAYHAEDVNSVTDQMLTSPPIALPLGQRPLTLQFWNYQEIEDRAGGCFDGGVLEISTDGGANWTRLESELLTDPYDGPISTEYSNPLAGENAWCGDPQDWLESIVALDAYAGETVQFRFRLATDSSAGREGWHIDDLLLQSCVSDYAATVQPDVSDQEVAPGQTMTHEFILTNVGLDDSYELALSGNNWPTTLLTSTSLTVTSGMTATLAVEVVAPPTLWLSDTFSLQVTSVTLPTLVDMTLRGTTTAVAHPAISIDPTKFTGAGELGTMLTYTLTISNSGDYTDTFGLSLAGNGWPTSAPAAVGPLAAGASAIVPVTVTVPTDLMDGDRPDAVDRVTLTAVSHLDSGVTAQSVVTTRADVVADMAAETAVDWRAADPGQTVTHTITLRNNGSYTDTFMVTLHDYSWPTTAASDTVGPLGPGEAAALEIYVTVGNEARDTVRVVFHSTLDESETMEMMLSTGRMVYLYMPMTQRE